MNLGYWTPYAEFWFKQRLDRIRCNEAKPKTAKQWSDDMRVARDAQQLRKVVDQALSTFLKRYGDRLFT